LLEPPCAETRGGGEYERRGASRVGAFLDTVLGFSQKFEMLKKGVACVVGVRQHTTQLPVANHGTQVHHDPCSRSIDKNVGAKVKAQIEEVLSLGVLGALGKKTRYPHIQIKIPYKCMVTAREDF
jgi:hypothetical protein